ncbi:type I-F CRISPR-associated helicase Cas3f [Parendozoicomonas sp. Alg238-R29]|uniref:type I-F CRISPR-associated helicase Cas3f n=1 Tax=Parendozoicomonas sp. Alg238-R29 TaxID=2993446 RepID=UPI00248E8ED9|nr:type I-F CRISPR-associated helicase Cas3f [Parendozoicomonas sp. Alg238-R29]
MMVTFVSQCEKNALKKTRRVLDAFANRIGDNVWQTVMTQDGLNAVKKLLRKTASKNTAVSCHWTRSRARSELVWIVGQRDKFDSTGVVPVNSTNRPLLNHSAESDWHDLPLIQALTGIAAILHDWGKASKLFQNKLQPNSKQKFKGDPIRHEWISCLLLNALVKHHTTDGNDDSGWLTALAKGEWDEGALNALSPSLLDNPTKPMENLPPIASLVAWLVVSHHRLPLPSKQQCKNSRGEKAESIGDILKRTSHQWGYENRYDEAEYQARLQACFTFPKGLISSSKRWKQALAKWSNRLLACQPQVQPILADNRYRVVLHHARLCLMLGDHKYSSQDAAKNWPDTTGLFANTDSETKELKQKLDEHLVGVAQQSVRNAWLLPAFENEPPQAKDVASLRKKSPPAFAWQDKAVLKIKQWRAEQPKKRHGFFAVNMAGTGQGKTFANAKIMRALSEDANSLRYILALGLRTLTLQTGDEYRDRIGLDSTELAVLIGSRAVMELHQQARDKQEESKIESCGSASQEALLDEEVDFECALPEEGLTTLLTTDRDRKFLYAPVLACTIDHMMAATETKRGGRYILPALRLLSSDLVIDEVDDFTGHDLIAIGRLIHLAGMLGRKVMISSATIPPDLAEGYFKAYRDGWQLFCKTRNASQHIGCAWIDEFNAQVITSDEQVLFQAISAYRNHHAGFVKKRVAKLEKAPVKRRADIVSCQPVLEAKDEKQKTYFELIAQSALHKHQCHHTTDTKTGINVSFGVVRMANIQPCVSLSQSLLEHEWPEHTQVRVMAYHSQQVLLMRHRQEQHLDQVLKRKEKAGEEPQAFRNPVIRQHLDQTPTGTQQLLFVLVATPVEEVGRDHDFDWAVVEPSSYRSIVQLAGRVLRHRNKTITEPNVSLLQYNWKGIENIHRPEERVFLRPGFEEFFTLKTHNLSALIDEQAIGQRLDAVPRIQKPSRLDHTGQLADLEHEVTHRLLTNYRKTNCPVTNKPAQIGPGYLKGYLEEAWFLTAVPQALTPFRDGPPSMKVFLVYDNELDTCRFCEKDKDGWMIDREAALNIQRTQLSAEAENRLWLKRDYEQALAEEADVQENSKRRMSLRYGELSFRFSETNQYAYNDQLGLVKIIRE